MAAILHDALCASHWSGHKPADYKGQDLDKALKAYESAAGKLTDIPSNLIPPTPILRINQIDSCIANLKSAMSELDKCKATLNPAINALKAVQSAAGKTKAELTELSKGDDVDQKTYTSAANEAGRIAGLAGKGVTTYQ